jgi:hypothetical protein
MLHTPHRPLAQLLPHQCSAREFRERAAECFRLARTIADGEVIGQLQRIGSAFEAKAEQLEAEF